MPGTRFFPSDSTRKFHDLESDHVNPHIQQRLQHGLDRRQGSEIAIDTMPRALAFSRIHGAVIDCVVGRDDSYEVSFGITTYSVIAL